MVQLKVKIADNTITLAQGLMGVRKMPDDEGMLFVFPSKREASFWGKDTYIPLDLAFIADDVITEITSIVPMSTKPVRSAKMCNRAIEANAGWFGRNNIKVGSKIEIKEESGQQVVTFI